MKDFLDYFKGNFFIKFLIFLYALFTSLFANAQIHEIPSYQPKNISLEKEIIKMDSIYFNAYNTCDIETQRNILSNNIEFFHDKGGLSTSKKEILESLQKNICNKVKRTLIDGSVEVYPIKNYGAIQIAYHKFFNNQEPNQKSIPVKFMVIWKKEETSWKMTKIISLH